MRPVGLLIILLACGTPPTERAEKSTQESAESSPPAAPETTPRSPDPAPPKPSTPPPEVSPETAPKAPEDAVDDPLDPTAKPEEDPPTVLPDENTGEWQRFFVDGCWESLAKSKHEALATCEHLREGAEDPEASHPQCECDEALIIEVRSSDPVFGWTSRRCWNAFFGRTQEGALARCTRDSNDYTREHCPCEPGNLAAVRGPYTRSTKVQLAGSDFVYLSAVGQWLDSTGDWPCFTAGTLIETSAGPRTIEEVEIGDLVRAYDVDADAFVWSRVRRVKQRLTPALTLLTLADGSTLSTTPNHPFFVPLQGEWRAAEQLRKDDILLGPERRHRRLVATSTREQETTVYNLSTEAPHDYFAGGVLVHNY